MIKTDKPTDAIIAGNNRRYTAAVHFDFLSLAHDPSVQIFAPNAVTGCIPDQVAEPVTPYFSDRLFTNVSIKNRLFPTIQNIHAGSGWQTRRTIRKSKVGYIGARAAADGSVHDVIGIRFSPRNVSFLRLVTDSSRIIIDAIIVFQNQRFETLFKYEIKNNTSSDITIPCQVTAGTSIMITITKATPSKRTWILSFTPALTKRYAQDEIVGLKYEIKKAQNKDATIGRLYFQSIDLNLANISRDFDFLNASSPVYNMLRKGVEISASLFLDDTSFNRDLGIFYVTDWEVSEDKATATAKAVDFIGMNKDELLNEPIIESTNILTCFQRVAERLGLYENEIDPMLSFIELAKYALQGKVGEILSTLCDISQTICTMNTQGTGIIVRRLTTIRGTSRYPSRYLTTYDYAKSDKNKTGDINPNIVEAMYTIAEYETLEEVQTKDVIMYSDIPVRAFPESYRGVDIFSRPIGAGAEPSYVKQYIKPDKYIRTEITDPFLPELFEFVIYDDGPEIEVFVWLFEEEEPDMQFTISVLAESDHNDILLDRSSHTVNKKPGNYIDPDLIGDTPEERNRFNQPQELEIKLDGLFTISSILPGNRSAPGVFEYLITKTGTGCKVKVWNYLPTAQEFTVSIFGKRIIDSKETRIIELKNDDDIAREGAIKKQITLKGVASDEIAQNLARSTAAFYRTFRTAYTVDPWADPRLQVTDLIAIESIRGYGYTQGIIEEITLTYNGYITQKAKLLDTQKHNRDCRVFGGYAIDDRPVMSITQEGYV